MHRDRKGSNTSIFLFYSILFSVLPRSSSVAYITLTFRKEYMYEAHNHTTFTIFFLIFISWDQKFYYTPNFNTSSIGVLLLQWKITLCSLLRHMMFRIPKYVLGSLYYTQIETAQTADVQVYENHRNEQLSMLFKDRLGDPNQIENVLPCLKKLMSLSTHMTCNVVSYSVPSQRLLFTFSSVCLAYAF
jgi:hypothetical protein